MVLDLKINWVHFRHMTNQGLVLQSLLRLDILVSWFFMCGLVIEMACVYVDYVSLDIHEQHDFILHNNNEDCLNIIVFFHDFWTFESWFINLQEIDFWCC
jgi:hypothetical protein